MNGQDAGALAAAKRVLRARVRESRRERGAWAADDPRRRAEARALADAVLRGGWAHLERSRVDAAPVCSYEALPTEPPTHALQAALLGRGLPILLPLLLPDRDLDWELLRPDGEREGPLGCDAIARARLIVVPALAVDACGRRLGQGGGSYDRALARARTGALIVALIDDDLSDDLPAEPHDRPVDAAASATRGWRLVDPDEAGPRGGSS